MALYRQFKIGNALSSVTKQYYLMADPSQKHFFYNPTGLGFEKKYESTKQGNIETIDSVEFEMLDITGEIIFYGDTIEEKYKGYSDFIQFVKLKPLQLFYLPAYGNDEYYCDVLLTKVEKKEIDPKTDTLRIPVTFHRTGQWISKDTVYTLKNELVGSGKYYDLERDYYYAGSQLNNITIENLGTDEVGFRFEIDGYVKNPEFRIRIQNGEQYGIISLSGEYTKVRIISIEDKDEIYLEDDGVIIGSPFNKQNFNAIDGKSYFTFIKIKPGVSIGSFSADNIDTFDGTVQIVIKGSNATI